MEVAVLGCGPSGMVAAHAAREMGMSVTVFSRKLKSPIFGAQFLHAHIPNINDPEPHFVKWEHRRNPTDGLYRPEDYLRKVYGSAWDGTVSDEMFNPGQQAWDLRAVYDELWGRFGQDVVNWSYTPDNLQYMIERGISIINTLPRELLCQNKKEHFFNYTNIWALGDNHTHMCPYRPDEMTVVYNGEPFPSWYRASNIFGHCTMEWPGSMKKPPVEGVVSVRKPILTNCSCWPTVRHVGRYGMWRKGVLLHHVYEQTRSALDDLQQGVLF